MIKRYLEIGLLTSWFNIFFLRYRETAVQADTQPIPQSFLDANSEDREAAQDRYRQIRLQKRVAS